MPWTVHIDGGARGNPGPAAAGIVLRDENGALLLEAGYLLGEQTNNVAEYSALVRAVNLLIERGATSAEIFSDSELLVQQMTGEYRVRNAKLGDLHREAQRLLLQLDSWVIRHIRRDENRRADFLVNHCLDAGRDVVLTDASNPGMSSAASHPAAPRPAGRATRADASAPIQSDGCSDSSQPDESPNRIPSPGRQPLTQAAPSARRVRVVCTTRGGDTCPAGGTGVSELLIGQTIPAAVCIHAAQALLPTVIAAQNTSASDFASIPTMTVRCMHRGCGAVFQVAPAQPGNGEAR